MNVVFYLSAVIAVAATLMVVTRLNAVHALLYLIVSLLAVAVVFYTLGAPLVAALEVIIYAGAIMVLFIFIIMMFNLGPMAVRREAVWLRPAAWIGPGLLTLVLLGEFVYVLVRYGIVMPGAAAVGPKAVGMALFDTYLLGVELASVLLLAGLVGAYHLGRHIHESELTEPESEAADGYRAA